MQTLYPISNVYLLISVSGLKVSTVTLMQSTQHCHSQEFGVVDDTVLRYTKHCFSYSYLCMALESQTGTLDFKCAYLAE